tara:strand:+ start:942 stop:1172 length:231 start_codon:yes stop_codon:yes gene_type:complete
MAKKTNAVNLSNNTPDKNKALMAKYKSKRKKTKSKKYTVGVDGPKFTGGSVPFVPGVIGKVVKTKKIIDYVKKKLR